MKKVLVMLLVLGLLTGVVGFTPVKAATSIVVQITIGSTKGTISGKQVVLDQPPIIESGRTLVPFRFIGEAIGATVSWVAASKKVTYVLGKTTIVLTIGSTTGTVNGKKVTLEVAPKITSSGRTIVPIRFVSENIGAKVDWNATTHMVTVTLAGGTPVTAKFHIGVITGTVSQSEDEFDGAQRLLKDYGDAKNGGIFTTLTFPDNFTSEQETTISEVVGLADDPLMKAIVFDQAVVGATEAFKQVRAKRPDILLFAGDAAEDPILISAAADQIVSEDDPSMGYYMVWNAKQMGAKTFVYTSFPRHMSMEVLSRQRNICEQACKDMGITFVFQTCPDPVSDIGVAGAQQFMLENTPTWIKKYGKATAFYNTNLAEIEPLLKMVIQGGAIYAYATGPLLGFPGALGLDLSAEKGNFPAITAKVQAAVVAAGDSGHIATWAWSKGYSFAAGLGEYAKNIIEGTAKLGNKADLLAALVKYTPGAAWSGIPYKDLNTGKTLTNNLMMTMDSLCLGKGYMGTTKNGVPAKYLSIK